MIKSNRRSEYNKLNYTQKIIRINRKLRFGDINRVANSTGYSQNFVSEVLSGLYKSEKIVNEAYDITRGRVNNATKLSALAS